jgi:hypothetical protein
MEVEVMDEETLNEPLLKSKRSRGGRKAINYKALQKSVIHVFDNLDPAMDEFEKKHFLIKVYSRYYETTRHKMHSRGIWPIDRIASSITETTINDNGWKTITRRVPIFNADGDKENMKYKRYLRRLVQ